jgi:ribonuclease P protein component
VVVHFLDQHSLSGSGVVAGTADDAARVGFVVSKAVGNAVVRNRVHRRLRAVMASRLPELPVGSLTVVRALPASATASYAELVADVDAALRRVLVDSR